ncbi:thiaminase /4-amino-5-aminomethyl-2-methylpyrimidine deaminase [Fodinibius roseus]|uniref:Aminopyrimidine aminohydrolase n=1 Tax=Fodinibius roseus TaxID=1194090 RepID=A0A1M5IK04_9BACT|nr:thiaminase II [Fodinibius roseus]SHG28389.1 thiaminase /4-amino-5-aminomethyl-2-methylpyrimidine deaminase [Fodinibius roseus]
MTFTDQLWSEIEPIYDAIMELPFIRELTEGTLPEEVFLFYLKQDTLYLADFSRTLSLAGVRSDRYDHMNSFFQYAANVAVVEGELHQDYYEQYGVEMEAEKSPSCFAYTNFLLSTAATKDNVVTIAALLPCFWIYREVGLEIYEEASADNPYREWIDTYAGDEFNEGVDRAITITDAVAEQEPEHRLGEMTEAFVKSTELEWMFWKSAYEQEQWPFEEAYGFEE